MNAFWYKLLVGVANLCGAWFFVAVSRIIAVGYFLFSGRAPESCRFYGALYPDSGRLYRLFCTFRQYQNFTTIHFDKFLLRRARPATYTSEGWENLEGTIGRTGAVLLMSHLGNWEMAATLLQQRRTDLQLLLYMGIKEKEGVERMQKDELRARGVTIIGVEQDGGSPFTAVEGIRVLKNGGILSMAGDIVWRSDQRRVRVTFLGHDAFLPEAPFVFALVAGAPLLVFFAFRTGENSYHFSLSEPIQIQASTRAARSGAIAEAAQHYADLLEQSLRQHPFEWYHFDRFIH